MTEKWQGRSDRSEHATEVMAGVVRDFKTGKILLQGDQSDDAYRQVPARSVLANEAVLIDVRGVYDHWMENDGGSYIYEDHHVAPPWENALFVYANSVCNVMAVHLVSWDRENDEPSPFPEYQPENVDHAIYWPAVRWVISAAAYSGGQHSSGIKVPTAGPMVLWRIPVYADGTIADLHWTLLTNHPGIEVHDFDNALMTLLATLDLCNCVNVNVAVPTRPVPRPHRRRMERTGVRFSEIHIRPVSTSYRGKGPGVPFADMPAHGVRGHFSEYGINGKGLLFGKHAGRFWVPPHVRGSKGAGEILQSYVAEA